MATIVELGQLVDHWQDGASQTLPTYTELTSLGFAQAGDPVSGVMATRPGAAWFNLVAAMRVSVIRAAGMTPSSTPDPLQFLTALQSLAWIKDKTITAAMMADAIITAAKLANSAVETAKIKDAAVTAVKLAAAAVESGKIATGAVTGDKIANAVITFDKLASGAIATEEQAIAGTLNNVLMTPLLVAKAIAQQLPPAIPTGAIIFFDLTECPSDFLICDHSAVSRTTYANLFAKIGTRHGAGDGSTTFNLPDMDARFLEGTTDTGQVGTNVEAGLPNISGTFGSSRTLNLDSISPPFYKTETDVTCIGSSTGHSYWMVKFDASLNSSIYRSISTVQPAALLGLACIKF